MKYQLKPDVVDSVAVQEQAGHEEQLRSHLVEKARSFKSSWVELARALYSVWRDKLYKDWGYMTFEGYTGKELSIRRTTAMKLLGSYSFLEKEEPKYVSKEYYDSNDTAVVPHYESVDVLRRAQNKGDLDPHEYSQLKEKVLERGVDAKAVKKDLTMIMKQRKETDPQQAHDQERDQQLKRMVSRLKVIKRDLEVLNLVPGQIIDQAQKLIQSLEMEIS